MDPLNVLHVDVGIQHNSSEAMLPLGICYSFLGPVFLL